MGPEKRIFFELITSKNYITQIFCRLHTKTDVSKLWTCYWKIYNTLRSETHFTGDFIKIKCKEFLDLFIEIYQVSKITPYIHMLSFHVPELYEKYGPLNYFSGQGLEKLNDLTTVQFFRNTNKKESFLKQLLERDFRLCEYETNYCI